MNKKVIILIAIVAVIVFGLVVVVLVSTNSGDQSSQPSKPAQPNTPTSPNDPGGSNPTEDIGYILWENGALFSDIDTKSIKYIHFIENPYFDDYDRAWKFNGMNCYIKDGVVYVVTGSKHSIEGSMNGAFENLINLVSISGFEHLDTTHVDNMSNMFLNCDKLESLILRTLNTENVMYAEAMFKGCSSLTIIDLSLLDMRKVVNMDEIFAYCTSASEIALPQTRDIVSLRGAFEQVGTTSWPPTSVYGVLNTDVCQDMSNMFKESVLTDYTMAEQFNTSSLVNAEGMFYSSAVSDIDLTSWDTHNLVNTSRMFVDTTMFTCNLSGWNMGSIKLCDEMFWRCEALSELTLNWSNIKNMQSAIGMFKKCSSLTQLDLSCFNGVEFDNTTEMFMDCEELTTIYCSGIKSKESQRMFDWCCRLVGKVKYSENAVDASMATPNGYFKVKK